MKVKNKRLYDTNQDTLQVLRQEYVDMGFDTDLDPGVLTVYAIRRKKPKSKDDKKSPKARNKE